MKKAREKLISAAVALFYEKGYSKTSIRDIGNKANITSSLIYHYFEDKEEILFEIVNAVSKTLVSTLVDIEKNVSDPIICLRKMINTLLLVLKRKKEFKIWIEEQYFLRGKRHMVCWNHQRQIFGLFRKKLEEISEAGKMNEVDLTIATFSIFGTINWVPRWYKKGGRLSRDKVVENILKFIFYGVINQTSSET